MLLDDSFECGRIAFAVPGTLRIDDRNRPAFADAQTVGLCSQDAALIRETKLAEAAFQKVPGGGPALQVAALRLRLLGAQEDVAPRDRHADRFRDFEERI